MQTQIFPTMEGLTPGMRVDQGPHDDGGYVSEESVNEIPFGVAVAQGTADFGCKLLGSGNDVVVGVALQSNDYAKGVFAEVGTVGVKPKCLINARKIGRLAVKVEEAVVAGDRAFVRFADGTLQANIVRGAFRKSQDTVNNNPTCIDLTKVAVFRTSAALGGTAIVELSLTVKP